MSPKPTAQRRRDRRDLLDVLLGRMLRGVLTTPERALLAETVREEQRTADQTRRSLGETGKAYGEHRAAADAAIREAEAERDQARAELKTLGRAAVEYQQRAWDAEARVREAEQALGEEQPRAVVDAADTAPTEGALSYADLCAAYTIATQRAEQAEQALGRSESAREHLRRRLGEAARAAQEAEAVTTETKRLMERRTRTLRERAERAEERLARIRDMADAWERQLPATIRTATAAEAVRNAANGDDRPVMFAVTAAPVDDQAAEDYRGALSHALGLGNGAPWDAIHERARALYAAEERAAHYRDTRAKWAREADAEILAHRQRAEDAEHRAARYRLAWMACRRDRKADRAAMAAELPAVEAVEHVRAQVEDWLQQPPAFTYESRRHAAAVATVARIIRDLLPPRPDAGLSAAEAADRMRQWAAAGIPAADLLADHTGEQRCPSCEHLAKYHTDPAGCCFAVARGKPEQNTVCGCAVTFRP
ncbi:hypothetical protein [Streptomyces sp. NPDC003278]|uniref:hypothetical protein n=1 Tax=Streptomyces sp. NPDC003278 TaxID=3364679 RepID=UPI00369B4AD7